MTMGDYRSPSEIEREIEEERRSLTGTLDELQDRFSFDRLTTEAGDYLRTQSGEIAGAFSRAVKENPMAVILTGVGVAWMILGSRRSRGGWQVGEGSHDDYGAYSGSGEDDYAGVSTYGRSAYAYRAGTESRYSGGYYDEGDRTFSDTMTEDDPDWVRSYADVLGEPEDEDGGADTAAWSGGAGQQQGRGRLERARSRLSRMRERLSHGTEDLSEEGRRRVLAARERAVNARHAMARQWSRQSRAARGAFDRQPLAAGAVAFAAGAAVAAALPRTQIEEEYLGEQSEHLMREAERIFEEERGKLGRVARAAAEEAKAVASDVVEDIRDGTRSAGEDAKSGVRRVAERARDEAERQKLGVPTGTSSDT